MLANFETPSRVKMLNHVMIPFEELGGRLLDQ
jgi:hypothetical protein